MNLGEIQEALRREKVDGWLFFDHHHRDPLAYHVLGFEPASQGLEAKVIVSDLEHEAVDAWGRVRPQQHGPQRGDLAQPVVVNGPLHNGILPRPDSRRQPIFVTAPV